MTPKVAAWDALGTQFKITIWDELPLGRFETLVAEAKATAATFDAEYSRFKPDSLIGRLRTETGIVRVPPALVAMLRIYMELSRATDGLMTPTIGMALEDAGYDPSYTLTPKHTIRDTPRLEEALRIIDSDHIELLMPVLLDLGALGKGFLIDRLYSALYEAGVQRFLIDGSGDIRYNAHDDAPITCALEHPLDPSLAVGTKILTRGALCASATNRRAWRGFNHYLDPFSKVSPQNIIATWVSAESATYADALSSALFFADADVLYNQFDFEYLVLDSDLNAKSSAGFAAELFVDATS